MNKTLLINIFKAIFFITTRSLRILLKIILVLFLNDELDKNIKKRSKWNREYDEYAAEVTKHEDF